MAHDSNLTSARPRSRSEMLDAIRALPPMPAAALRVVQVAQDPRSSASELALVVSADPALSARILKVANSASYRRSREVGSVQEALVVLGFVQTRNIAVCTAITHAYGTDCLHALFRTDAFWRHSLAVAFRASFLARRLPQLDTAMAFTAGVLHNIGRLAMFHADRAGVDQAIALAMRTGRPLEDIEQETLGYDHAELGGMLAEKWRLPAPMCQAISQHHDALHVHPSLASLVAEADRFCVSRGFLPGYTVPSPVGTMPLRSAEAADLIREVQGLMALVEGEQRGVRMLA
jgi:putative nucleotidyltransferase with HDIG domain